MVSGWHKHDSCYSYTVENSVPIEQHQDDTIFYLCEFNVSPVSSIKLQMSGAVHDRLCEKMGNHYKAERWMEARIAEVENLSAEAIVGYLKIMLKQLFLDPTLELDLQIGMLPNQERGM